MESEHEMEDWEALLGQIQHLRDHVHELDQDHMALQKEMVQYEDFARGRPQQGEDANEEVDGNIPLEVGLSEEMDASSAASVSSGLGDMSSTGRQMERRLSMLASQVQRKGKKHKLPEDIFTVILFASVFSPSFVYSLLVYGMQILILTIITIDLNADTLRDGESDGNAFNVPVEVPLQVRVAQVVAIMVSVVSRDDCTDTFKIVVIGWKKRWLRKFPAATLPKFVLMNVMRFSQGAYVIFVSFIFIVQSASVLDLFLNFAAIEFVSSLDNLAYELAENGWILKSMQLMTQKIEELGTVSLTQKDKSNLKGKPWLRKVLILLFLAGLYIGWWKVYDIQKSGSILEASTCGVVEVLFGLHSLDLKTMDTFVAFEIEAKTGIVLDNPEFELHTIAGSKRNLGDGFDAANPPILQYEYFSGNYVADYDNSINSRPVFYERALADPTSGKFYYCQNERSWVFTIDALATAGAVPTETLERCEDGGWLMRSSVTDAYSLADVSLEGWKIWTGALVDAEDFFFSCGQCNSDIDCGVTQGKCGATVAKQCDCNEGFTGNFCNDPDPCLEIARYYGLGVEILVEETGLRAYDRPFYTIGIGDGLIEALLFTGRRWLSVTFRPQQLVPFQVGPEGQIGAVPTENDKFMFNLMLHAYWGRLKLEEINFVSGITRSFTPTGPLEWDELVESRSIGEYGVLGKVEPMVQQLECLSVDCDITNVCGIYGVCEFTNITIYGDSVNTTFEGNQCTCSDTSTGHFCEFGNFIRYFFDGVAQFSPQTADIDPYGAACAFPNGPYGDEPTCYSQLYPDYAPPEDEAPSAHE